MMPFWKPGKFSTSVVFISSPPNSYPSNTRGLSSARAAYIAAVYPAGPEPMTITSRTAVLSAPPVFSLLSCGVASTFSPVVGTMKLKPGLVIAVHLSRIT